jgi:RES domain-containing protein
MRVWRICSAESAEQAFSGEATLSAARWHREGCKIVYASQSLSLAALEFWVHLDAHAPAAEYIAASAEVPDDIAIHHVDEAQLPPGWQKHPPPGELRDLGTCWLYAGETAVARVPSAVTPGEFNFLLNPIHHEWTRIQVRRPMPFAFDPRMWKCPDGSR